MFTCSPPLKDKMLEIFHHLHHHPEVSWEEKETTTFLKNVLEKEGCRVQTFTHSTGLFAELGSGNPVIAIRADIDALWQEVDGTFQANHSCGHDAHMTIVLGMMYLLKEAILPGTVRFIFQPAEEKGTGALRMVEEKVVDGVDYLFGVHLRPIQEVRDGYASPCIIHGAGRFIEGEIIGEDLHGARPHLGANAIEVGASLVQMLQTLHIDPLVPSSVKLTKFHAGGESSNIIPGNASFSIDMRAQTNEVMAQMQKKIEGLFKTVEDFYSISIEYEIESDTPAAVENEQAQMIMAKAISTVLGEEKCIPPITTTGGDDFHFYTIQRPSLKATMLGLGCDLKPGLHHPYMTFNKEAMFKGSEILAEAVMLAFEQK